MLISRCLHLNEYHQLLPGIPFWNGVALICVSSVTFIINYYRLINNSHSCIANVHVIISALFFFVNTFPGPVFQNLVFPFRWLAKEFIGMFHDLLALIK
jgi:hypothetical protein